MVGVHRRVVVQHVHIRMVNRVVYLVVVITAALAIR